MQKKNYLKTDIPIIMLYEMDMKSWTDSDRQNVIDLVTQLTNSLKEIGHSIINFEIIGEDSLQDLKQFNPNLYVVFNWCEGIPGISHSFHIAANILEDFGFTFTGSSATALQINGDKRAVKKILSRNNIVTPKWDVFDIHKNIKWELFPAIIKPAFEHCSIGITPDSVVWDKKSLSARVNQIWNNLNQPGLIEEFISGREFQVGVWGNEEINVLSPVEADFSKFEDPRDHLCTMDSKDDPQSYRFQLWDMIIPAQLNQTQIQNICQVSKNAYQALNCRDYARIDIRLRDNVFYILDVNANPYIGPECGLVRSAELEGYSYGEFGSQIVNFAYKRMQS